MRPVLDESVVPAQTSTHNECSQPILSRQVQQNVAWVALVILPLFFVVAGVVSWWRRR